MRRPPEAARYPREEGRGLGGREGERKRERRKSRQPSRWQTLNKRRSPAVLRYRFGVLSSGGCCGRETVTHGDTTRRRGVTRRRVYNGWREGREDRRKGGKGDGGVFAKNEFAKVRCVSQHLLETCREREFSLSPTPTLNLRPLPLLVFPVSLR